MTPRKEASSRVDGYSAAVHPCAPVFYEFRALPFSAETERFVNHHLGYSECVVYLGHVHVLRAQPRHLVGHIRCPHDVFGRIAGETLGARVFARLGNTSEHFYRLLNCELVNELSRAEHGGRCRIPHRAAHISVKRIRDHGRVEHFFYRSLFSVLRDRVHRGMMSAFNDHLRELLRRHAVFHHVPFGPHRVKSRHAHAERNFDVVLLKRQRAARHNPAQVLDPERKRDVVLSESNSPPCFPEGERAAPAGALDVDRGLADEPYLLKGPLTHTHTLVNVTAKSDLYLSRVDTGVFYRRPGRLAPEHVRRLIREPAAGCRPHAKNVYVSHYQASSGLTYCYFKNSG